VRRRVLVSGRVQGVWYRETCRRVATENAVAGWVRNNHDGTVEAVLEGGSDAVERVIAWMGTGPPQAHVEHVEVRTEAPVGEVGFSVR
jgi:acylphosphatase